MKTVTTIRTLILFSSALILWIKFVKGDEQKTFKICEKCICQWDEITPLIDCVSSDITRDELFKTVWDFEPDKNSKAKSLDQLTLDLDLASNPSLSIIRSLPDLPLEKLSFKSCNVTKVEAAAFKKLVYLAYLDLSHNSLDTLEKAMFEGPHRDNEGTPSPLLGINLSNNDLTSIGRSAFDYLVHLEDLDLSHNLLKLDDHSTVTALSSLPSLKSLSLAGNELRELPKELFTDLTGLTKLSLENNNFHTVPNVLAHLTALEELNINHNPIVILEPLSFRMLESMTALSISHMPRVERVKEEAFERLENLQILKMTDNPNLDHIDPDAFIGIDNSHLTELHLRDNNLAYLPDNLFQNQVELFKNLLVFDIAGNNWACDCHNQWLINVAGARRDQAGNAKCSSPEEFKDWLMADIIKKNVTVPCDNVDKFDFKPRDFGLGFIQDDLQQSDSSQMMLALGLISVLSITASIVLVIVLHAQHKKKVRYSQMSVKFQRQQMENPVYRDTTVTVIN